MGERDGRNRDRTGEALGKEDAGEGWRSGKQGKPEPRSGSRGSLEKLVLEEETKQEQ